MQFDPEDRPRPMWGGSFGDDAVPGIDPSTAPLPSTSPAPAPSPPIMMPVQQALQPLPAPAPVVDPKASRRAGLAIIITGAGVGTGALLGGAWGAGSGLFFAGALSNVYRSNTLWRSDYADDRKEAVKTTAVAVIGLGLAGYLGYRAQRSRDKDD